MQNVTEWSLEFDLMYNNITSNKAPGLEPYEKSVLLTRAQEALVLEIFDARNNAIRVGFDGGSIRQSDFATLVNTCSAEEETTELFTATSSSSSTSSDSSSISIGDIHINPDDPLDTRPQALLSEIQFDNRSSVKRFLWPSDLLIMINEQVTDTNGKIYIVRPLSYEEYSRLMTLPYKYPAKGQAWRLIVQPYGANRNKTGVELIARFPSGDLDYRIRYVRKPKPIILEDLSPMELSIDGENKPMVSELPEHLHLEIIHRAVMLAKLAWADTVAQKQ